MHARVRTRREKQSERVREAPWHTSMQHAAHVQSTGPGAAAATGAVAATDAAAAADAASRRRRSQPTTEAALTAAPSQRLRRQHLHLHAELYILRRPGRDSSPPPGVTAPLISIALLLHPLMHKQNIQIQKAPSYHLCITALGRESWHHRPSVPHLGVSRGRANARAVCPTREEHAPHQAPPSACPMIPIPERRCGIRVRARRRRHPLGPRPPWAVASRLAVLRR